MSATGPDGPAVALAPPGADGPAVAALGLAATAVVGDALVTTAVDDDGAVPSLPQAETSSTVIAAMSE